MREFRWCRQELAEGCEKVDRHVHVCICTPGGRQIYPKCGRQTLSLAFHDLDPEAIRRTMAHYKDPAKGQELIDNCMTEAHAKLIAEFVGDFDLTVIVNCEAGISRSPGVVLALRRKYGGDTEECYREAHPNIHVASMLGKVLGVGPFQAKKYEEGDFKEIFT
jgi:predicted protein tyrosine phosphatase